MLVAAGVVILFYGLQHLPKELQKIRKGYNRNKRYKHRGLPKLFKKFISRTPRQCLLAIDPMRALGPTEAKALHRLIKDPEADPTSVGRLGLGLGLGLGLRPCTHSSRIPKQTRRVLEG